ncbi:precorrin-8X methylmutase [Frankia sp. QA3]|uniref:precorrin-8X methylmutase n=1 Tax=Frankia sp. QA3 TaxID=710111 RepID=UPI000269BBDB|nr:precorrin-8X methylmutase [Frankia sp. QA3]EIV92172.1 precorrin isomerase [Frankia sp. QA3]
MARREPIGAVDPVERMSYAVVRARLDTSRLPRLTRAVLERVVHASADVRFADDLVCREDDLHAGVEALRAGVALVTDVPMTALGLADDPRHPPDAHAHAAPRLAGRPVVCGFARADPDVARRDDLSRPAVGVALSVDEVGPGAIYVIGAAPSALEELLSLADVARPAFVVGLPVGFVGSVEAKMGLRDSGIPALSNRSARGGPAVAAAAVHALLHTIVPD